jgi:ABC-type bacteriocin/lantibiotic exporter with double-glycine peptidase domain
MTLFGEIWGMLTQRQRRRILAMQLVSLVMAFSTSTGIAAIAPFFAVLGDPKLVEHNALLHWLYVQGSFSNTHGLMLALGVGFIAVVFIANLINALGFLAMNRLALRIGNELQTTLFDEYLSRPYAFHTATNSTTLFNNIVHETTRVTHGILQNSFVLVTNLVTATLIILSILLLNHAVAIAMIAALAGGYIVIYLAVRNRLLRIGHTQSGFATEQTQIVNESFGAIKEIIILQVRSFFRDRFERASQGFLLAVAHSQIVAQSPRYVMECVAAAGLVGVALMLGGREAGIGPWLGTLTFLAFAAYRLLPTLQQVFVAIVRIRADRAALRLLAPDLRRARAAQRAAPPLDRNWMDASWRERPRREIQLTGVSYRYTADRPWALRDASLRIPARAAVGIVGANGSGKSTLVDLIAGLLTPAAGVVEIDGCALDDSNRAAWQRRIAYVPQNIFLLDASVAQNIALGIPADAIEPQRLRQAAQLVQLDEFVMDLPAGYGQPIGQHGIAVSGGQRQRIGIARALYRDAAVLLLDEATNALDGLTEHELMTTLRRLRGRYTILLIAHRMSTVRACDVIFHLEQGRIIGSGTYEELLKSSEGFRRMAGVR